MNSRSRDIAQTIANEWVGQDHNGNEILRDQIQAAIEDAHQDGYRRGLSAKASPHRRDK